jgi:hypothetical protein
MAFLRIPIWRRLLRVGGIASQFLLGALCVALVLLLQSPSGAGPASLRSDRDVATFAPANINELLRKPNAIEVKVGAYVGNFHDLSLQNRRFVAEGYYWLEWPQSLQNKLDSEEIKPKSIIVLSNQVDNWDGQINSFSEVPMRLANGNYYQQFQFSANFYIPEINLRRFPFESVQLPVIFEIGADSLAIQKGNVILVPDTGRNALLGSFAEINGYRITSSILKPIVHAFGTNFGLKNGDLSYSAVALQATLKSTPLPSILKYFLPLMIVVGIVIMAPSLEGELGDLRLAIPSTGLLTLIFLQQTYQGELPALDYLTFLDWIYACGYVISIGTFVLFVWGTNFYQRSPKKAKEHALATINRADTIFQASAVLGILVAALLAWMA